MSFKTLKAMFFVAALFLLMGLLGCNTSIDDKVNEIEPEQIKIGLMAPLTGPLAGAGLDIQNTARMAANEINLAGGVNGQEIGFLVRDTRLGREDSVEASLAAVNDLMNEGVIGIIGPAGSGTTITVSPVTIAHGVPLISPSATSPALSDLDDNDLVWRTVASDAFQGVFLAQQLLRDGIESISVIYRDDAYGSGLQQSVTESFSQAGGSILTSISYPANKESGFENEVEALFQNGTPDALVVISFVIDGANIMVSLANTNRSQYPALYGVDGNNRQEFIGNSPPQLVEGMRGSSPTAPSGSANYQAFSERFENQFNKPPTVFTESTYDAVYLLALSMAVGGENSSLSIRNNLRSLSQADTADPLVVNVGPTDYRVALNNLTLDLDLQGAASDINFDINGDVTSGNYIFWEIVEQDGQLVFTTLRESSFP